MTVADKEVTVNLKVRNELFTVLWLEGQSSDLQHLEKELGNLGTKSLF